MPKSKNVTFVLLSLVSLLTLLIIYYPALSAKLFTVDDSMLIEIPQIQKAFEWASVKSLFKVGAHIDYYPIRDLSYMFDQFFFPNSFFAARVHQLTLFWLCSVGLGFLSLELGVNLLLSLSLCTLWVLHPYHAETILWLSARKDVLSIFFGIWTCYFFVKGLTIHKKIFPILTFLFFSLSLFSKATFALLPGFAMLGCLTKKESFLKHKILISLCCFLSLVYSIFQFWFYSQVNPMNFPLSYDERFVNSLTALGRMFSGWFVIAFNAIDIENISQWATLNKEFFVIGIAFYLFIVFFILRTIIKKEKNLQIGIGLFFILYIPVSGLIFPHLNFYSTRYFEAPSLVFWGMLAYYLSYKSKFSIKANIAIFSFFFALFIIGSYTEAQVWKESKSIRIKALNLSPNSLSLQASYFQELINTSSKDITTNLIVEKNQLAQILQKSCEERRGSKEYYNCRLFFQTAFQIHSWNNHLPEAKIALDHFIEAHSFLITPPKIISRFHIEYELLTETPAPTVLENFLKENRYVLSSHYRWLELSSLCLLGKKEASVKKFHDYQARNLLGSNSTNAHPNNQFKIDQCLK